MDFFGLLPGINVRGWRHIDVNISLQSKSGTVMTTFVSKHYLPA